MNPRAAGGALAAIIGICAPAIAYFEGMLPTTYADPVGIPTLCYGHTGADVVPGRVASLEECEALLQGDIATAYAAVTECIGVPMRPYQAAALTSFTFNVGRGALCRSTLARKANYGDWIGACAELSKWTYAKGVQLPGLVKRRAAERAMCEGKQPSFTRMQHESHLSLCHHRGSVRARIRAGHWRDRVQGRSQYRRVRAAGVAGDVPSRTNGSGYRVG